MRMAWYEWVPSGRVTWPVLVGAWKFFRGRKVTPQDKLALRSKWKPLFQEYIADHRRRNLRLDAIIRDMKRIDNYPESSDTERGKGISSWFRVGLIDTYEKGFMVGLMLTTLFMDPETGDLRYADRDGLEGLRNISHVYGRVQNERTI